MEHQAIEIQGVKIFGTPYSKSFREKGAFQYTPESEQGIFNSIPSDIDILITHHPPFQILDTAIFGYSVGSKVLRRKVLQIRPKIHIFGHVHESHAISTHEGIVFINAATELKQFNFS